MSMMDTLMPWTTHKLKQMFSDEPPKEEGKNTGSSGKGGGSRRVGGYSYSMPLDREPIDTEMFEVLSKRSMPGLDTQRRSLFDVIKGVGELKKQAEDAKYMPDISGLLAASDAIAGTDYMSKYKAPKTKAERQQDLLELQAGLGKLAGGLSKQEIEMLKAQFQPRGGQMTERITYQKPKGSGGKGKYKSNQYLAAGYGRRIQQAEAVFQDLRKSGYDRTGGWEGAKGILPGFMSGLKGEELVRQEQAERNFVNAILRRESGAAISSSEFSTAERQYFPRVGDSAETLAQKKANRDNALKALRAEAGGAWNEVTYSDPLAPYQSMAKEEEYQGWLGNLFTSPFASDEKPSTPRGAAPRKSAPRKRRSQQSFEAWKKAKGL